MTSTDIEKRLEQHDTMLNNFAKEQHQTNLVLSDIKNSINQIMVYVKGDHAAGIPGIVSSMTNFKRDFMSDYIKDQNLNDEKMKTFQNRVEWAEGRIKTLEETDTKDSKKHGYYTGIYVVLATAIGYLLAIYL